MTEIHITTPAGFEHYVFSSAEQVSCATHDADARLVAEEQFWHGKPSGLQKSWDENGQLTLRVALLDADSSGFDRQASIDRFAKNMRRADKMEACAVIDTRRMELQARI